jgi:hypothetical protein
LQIVARRRGGARYSAPFGSPVRGSLPPRFAHTETLVIKHSPSRLATIATLGSLGLALLAAPLMAAAQTAPAKPAAKPAAKKPAKPAAKPVAKKPAPAPLPDATPEQLSAAQLVYYGHYECEFKQVIDIASNSKNAGYVDVKHGKADYLMKPVLSSTGAVRLEDVKGETLMVQIANKSMLMNVKAGHRIVDECVSPQQRELTLAAARAKEAAAAASAAQPASAPASSQPPTSAPGEPASAPMASR